MILREHEINYEARGWQGQKNIKKVTNIHDIPSGAEWIKYGNNYDQVMIRICKECRESCDGRVELKIKGLTDSKQELMTRC